MKKIILLLFLLLIIQIPNRVKAVVYEDVDRDKLLYNINNFYIENNNIIINGWAVTNNHWHLTGDDTHEFSLVLTKKGTNINKVYVASLKYADKTRLMQIAGVNTECTVPFTRDSCYYKYIYSGFEFSIPTDDLEEDADYDILLRIYEKYIDKGYQEHIYVLGIDDTYENNGVRYQLYSDINKTSVIINSHNLYVRSGPGQNYSIKRSELSCGSTGKTLYWDPMGTLSNIKGASQTNPGAIDSEMWVNLKYRLSDSCIENKARAINGEDYDGWAPWVYMLGTGEPAIIKVTSLSNITIDELRTYTAEANSITKAIVTITSSRDEKINIKAYHNDNLVYDSDEQIAGTKSYTINYKIPNNGTFKVVVKGKNKTATISSNIYVSSKKTYHIDSSNQSGIITVGRPILVVTDKNRNVTEYKEKIQLSAIPYEVNLSQGRGITGVTSAITYWYPLEEFSLNSDYSVYALYPSQEKNLNYQIENGKVKVNLEKEAVIRGTNVDVSYFHHPNVLLSLIRGDLYSSELAGYNYYNGGGIWYPSWNDDLGTYEYEYVGTNLGINKVSIIRDLTYTITSTMFGDKTGKFYIKRVENPTNLNIIFKKKFSYEELMEYVK